VEVGTAQVSIDEEDTVSSPRQRNPHIGRHQRLADASLATSESDDAARALGRR
jgi:hypothetical protein